jgi:hypothetical protein
MCTGRANAEDLRVGKIYLRFCWCFYMGFSVVAEIDPRTLI